MNMKISNNIMSNMTTKELLLKWSEIIFQDICISLNKYYMKTRNIDVGDKKFVINRFKDTQNKIIQLTPVLEDLINEYIYGLEDIFISLYGVISDEVYALRIFNKLFNNIESWDEDYMWNDCNDKRLLNIIT